MNTLELFSWSASFSKERKKLWDKIFTVDYIEKYNPDLVKDILQLEVQDLPVNIDILWISPPCTTFSIAWTWKHWKDGKPSKEAKVWLKILDKTIQLLSEIKPKYWYLENPRWHMRNHIEKIFNKYWILRKRVTITYCQYWWSTMKPTDIRTNNANWKPRKMCKNGDTCHISAPRNSQLWLAAITSTYERSRIPKELFNELIKYE